MTTTTKYETTIEADPTVPAVRIVRDFDAPPEKVYRAWVDRELLAKWLGPENSETRIDVFDARTGGSYRYATLVDGQEVAAFYGSFHELRTNERLVQTFTWEGMPDGVCLETMTFTDLGDGRTRVTGFSVLDSFEGRDAMMASGMEVGVNEGYAKLDALLADG